MDITKEEIPAFDNGNGCKEVISVMHAMEALYMVVRCANAAYFARDFVSAYALMRDSLKLFKQLENRKAMAIAHNNLGNIMLAMYRYMQSSGEAYVAGMTKKEVIAKGIAYFREAIQLGEKLYDDFYDAEGWSVDCLDFMQTLSDRYFNRAMFYLTVKDDTEDPAEMERGGLADIEIARDMDVEIIDEGQQAGWNRTNRATKLFTVALSRARGHILLQEMGFPDDWEIDEVIDGAYEMIKAEIARPSSDLFHDTSSVGRLQQIETELMKYKKIKGELKVAAQVAVRVLYEDEFINDEAENAAAEVLLSYVEFLLENGDESCDYASLKEKIKDYQERLEEADVIQEESEALLSSAPSVNTSAVVRSSVSAVSSLYPASQTTRFSRNSLKGDVRMEDF
jgi:hypothetical protein